MTSAILRTYYEYPKAQRRVIWLAGGLMAFGVYMACVIAMGIR